MAENAASSPGRSHARLEELFGEAFAFNSRQVQTAIARQEKHGGSLADAFEAEGLLSDRDRPVALAIESGTVAIDLDTWVVAPHTANLLSLSLVEELQALPVKEDGGVVTVAMADPLDHEALDRIRETISRPVRIVVASEESLQRAMNAFHGEGENPTIIAEEIETSRLFSPPLPPRSFTDEAMVQKLWERVALVEGQVQLLRAEVRSLSALLHRKKED